MKYLKLTQYKIVYVIINIVSFAFYKKLINLLFFSLKKAYYLKGKIFSKIFLKTVMKPGPQP